MQDRCHRPGDREVLFQGLGLVGENVASGCGKALIAGHVFAGHLWNDSSEERNRVVWVTLVFVIARRFAGHSRQCLPHPAAD